MTSGIVSEVWSQELDGNIVFVRSLDDAIYIGLAGDRNGIMVFDYDGKRKGYFTLPSTPVDIAKGEDIHIALGDGILTLSPEGEKKWSFEVKKGINDLEVVDGNLFISGKDRNLYILGQEGNVINRHRSSEPFGKISSSPSGVVAVPSGSAIHLLTPTGEIIWTYNLKWPVNTIALSKSGNLIAVGAMIHIYAFDRQQRILWRGQYQSSVNSMIIPSNEKYIFVGLKDGKIMQIVAPKGSVARKMNLNGSLLSLTGDRMGYYLLALSQSEDRCGAELIGWNWKRLYSEKFSGTEWCGDISPDGRFIILASNGKIMVYENMDVYRLTCRNALRLAENFIEIYGEPDDESFITARVKLREAMEDMENGEFTGARNRMQEGQSDLLSFINNFILSRVPEYQKKLEYIKKNTSGQTEDIGRMEKLLSLILKRMESEEYHSILKLMSRAEELLKKLEKNMEIMKIREEEKALLDRVNRLKDRMQKIRDNLDSPEEIDTFLTTAESLISMSHVKEAVKNIERAEAGIEEAERQQREQKLSALRDEIEELLARGREANITLYDIEGLADHALHAMEEGNESQAHEYLEEIKRLVKTRTLKADPRYSEIITRIEEMEEKLRGLRDMGFDVSALEKLLDDCRTSLEDDIEKSEKLLKRVEDEYERITSSSDELEEMLNSLEDEIKSIDDQELSLLLLPKVEEARFSLVSGNIKRAESLAQRVDGMLRKYRAEVEVVEKDEDLEGEVKNLCPYCNAPLSGGERFCPYCGNPLEPLSPQSICPYCNVPLPEGGKYCPSCGRRLR